MRTSCFSQLPQLTKCTGTLRGSAITQPVVELVEAEVEVEVEVAAGGEPETIGYTTGEASYDSGSDTTTWTTVTYCYGEPNAE